MDFAQHINDNEQKLINDLNTIKSNLKDIFDFYELRQRSSDEGDEEFVYTNKKNDA